MEPDPPSPLAVARRIIGPALGAAAILLAVRFLATGKVESKLVALVALLWAGWGVTTGVLRTAGDLFRALMTRVLWGGSITLAEEIAGLEHLLAQDLPREREIQSALRLAEIYRKYRRDDRRADALLDRLHAKYPDAPELAAAHRVGLV